MSHCSIPLTLSHSIHPSIHSSGLLPTVSSCVLGGYCIYWYSPATETKYELNNVRHVWFVGHILMQLRTCAHTYTPTLIFIRYSQCESLRISNPEEQSGNRVLQNCFLIFLFLLPAGSIYNKNITISPSVRYTMTPRMKAIDNSLSNQ